MELKRAVDTRLRREVVGQMLDYAANAVAYWQAGTIVMTFAVTCTATGTEPDTVLAAFLTDGDPSAFWDQVDANFQAGRIKLVFVADTIPRELARIVEFLNEQMKADVRAVELKWYQNKAGATTLVPRIFGETERAATQKAATRTKLEPLNAEQWIEKNIRPCGEDAAQGAEAFIQIVNQLGGRIEVARTQGSISSAFKSHNGTHFSPLGLSRDNRISLSLGALVTRPKFTEKADRQAIYDIFVKAMGSLSTTNLQGYPAFPVTALSNPARRANFLEAARQSIALAAVD